MKKIFTLNVLLLCALLIQAQTQVKVTLDTKKFVNIDCSLGADCAGGPSPLTRAYMHSGLCTTGDIYCKTQIIPFNSLVWEHVVGNWGNSPQDDGVGEMINEGNGVFSKTIIIENYFSGSWVSNEWNETHTVQSTPMPSGATPYTMGLVFRSPDATLTGRDNMCNDIFVTDLNTENPKVIQSFDLLPWPNSPVTIQKSIIGIDDVKHINFFRLVLNPVTEQLNIEFYLNRGVHTKAVMYDQLGREVLLLLDEKLNEGKHWIKANVKELNVNPGTYLIQVVTESHTVTERVVVL